MAATFRMPTFDQPRSSTETDQRRLLDSNSSTYSASIYADTVDNDGDRTPRAGSPSRLSEHVVDAPSSAATESTSATGSASTPRHQSIAAPEQSARQGSYRGFASEEAYLDALRAWAEGRKYTEPTSTTLVGFYGATTMAEYANRPPAFQPLGLKKKWKAMKASRQEDRQRRNKERRATVA